MKMFENGCKSIIIVVQLTITLCVPGESVNLTEITELAKFGVFYNLNDFREYFTTDEAKEEKVPLLLKKFEDTCIDPANVTNPAKQYPFVSVEGIFRGTNKKIMYKLHNLMKARVLHNPPGYLAEYSKALPPGHLLRKAFFSLSHYAAGCEARDLVVDTPVVTTGYWLPNSCFVIARSFLNSTVPPPRKFFIWPVDLPKPDLIVLINPPPLKIHLDEVDSRMIECMQKNKDPPVVEINTPTTYENLAVEAIRRINFELQTQYVSKEEDAPVE